MQEFCERLSNVLPGDGAVKLRRPERDRVRPGIVEKERRTQDEPLEIAAGDRDVRCLLHCEVVLNLFTVVALPPRLGKYGHEREPVDSCKSSGVDGLGDAVAVASLLP